MKKIAILLVALAGMVPGMATAQSGSGVRIRWTYYSDSGQTEVVGESVEFCDGTTTWNGYPTAYGSVEEYEC